MNYIIKISTDEGQPKYVERMNGDIRAPSLTENIRRAKEYPEEKALEYLEKIRGFISKEKGGETVTAELEAVSSYEPSGGISGQAQPQSSAEAPKHSSYYIEGWGEPCKYIAESPKMRYICMYQRKKLDGGYEFAYANENGVIVTSGDNPHEISRDFHRYADHVSFLMISRWEDRQNAKQ